jgi:hypothetical protein
LTTADVSVLLFGERRLPRPLAGLAVRRVNEPAEIDAAVAAGRRLVVVGGDADLAAVLTRLLRADHLDVEVGHAPRWWKARRAAFGVARRVPLIRDETGVALVGAAYWLPEGDEAGARLCGEAVVDDTTLFDGEVTGVRIEPTLTMPGLRASALSGRMRPRRWVPGRAVQLGTTGARVVRDGVLAARPVKRSTFYRHTQGLLLVR